MQLTKANYFGCDSILTIKPIGDFHIGHVNCRKDMIKTHINMLSYNCRGLLMGDLLECGTKTSIGKGIFDCNMTPQKQKDYLYDLLKPKAEYIDGCVIGNHEERIVEMTTLDMLKDICRELKIPYHHYQGIIKYAWNGVAYTIAIWHGTGSGASIQTAFKQCEDMSNKVFSDIYCMGHAHKIATSDKIFKLPDTRNMTIQKVTQRFVLTGSSLESDDSYPEKTNMQERSLGFPTIELYGDRHNRKIDIKT